MFLKLIQQAAESLAAVDAAPIIARADMFAEIIIKTRISYQMAASQ